MVDQIVDIVEMLVRPAHRLAQDFGVGRFTPDQPFVHPFVQHRRGDIAEKLLVKPGNQPADLRPVDCGAIDHRNLFNGFLDIFADRHAVDQTDFRPGMFHHRRPAGRIHRQKIIALIPG